VAASCWGGDSVEVDEGGQVCAVVVGEWLLESLVGAGDQRQAQRRRCGGREHDEEDDAGLDTAVDQPRRCRGDHRPYGHDDASWRALVI
jgi:hypothetical protein